VVIEPSDEPSAVNEPVLSTMTSVLASDAVDGTSTMPPSTTVGDESVSGPLRVRLPPSLSGLGSLATPTTGEPMKITPTSLMVPASEVGVPMK